MPDYTDNYGLAKPYEHENYDINVQNDNMDIVDAAIKSVDDGLTDIGNELEAHKDTYAQQRQQDNLKVAKVEKELSDYKGTMQQVNVNQEAKQKVSGYGIVSLPPNAANGQVSASVKGLTLTNEVFVNRQNAYIPLGGGERIKLDKVTGNMVTNLSGYTENAQTINVNVNDKIFIYVKVSEKVLHGTVNLHYSDDTRQAVGIATNDKNEVYGTIIANANLKANPYAASNNLGVKTPTTPISFVVINQTKLGIVNFTEEQMVAFCRQGYFTGTKSTVSAMRLKSVGKNLLPTSPAEWEVGSLYGSTGNPDTSLNFLRTKRYIKILKDKTIVKSIGSGYSIVGTFFYDFNKNFISYSTNSIITVPTNAVFYKQVIRRSDSANLQISEIKQAKPQIEYNTATPYEPYIESTQYIQAKDESGKIVELRSLPNGTKDEVNVTDGKVTKNVSDVLVINGSLNWNTSTTLANTYRFILSEWAVNNNAKLSTANSAIAKSNDGDYISASWNGNDQRQIAFEIRHMYINVEKAKIDAMAGATTLDKFKEYLNQFPITLIYQLAEPIEIPIQVSGNIVSHPSGTVYIDHATFVVGIYGDNMPVSHNDLPIKTINKITRIDYQTGLEYELDASKAAIATDGLSYTHPDLQSGDIVFFDYDYDAESTEGETTIEYYDSRYVIKDSVTGKFYKWDIVVANGTPNITLVEV